LLGDSKIFFIVGRDGGDDPERNGEIKELIFLRDLHFGFLPDDCEVEFMDCFQKIATVKMQNVLISL